MSAELNGWYWVEWRGTLEPELFRDGQIRDLNGDLVYPSLTRNIGPRIPEPKELKATELRLAKLQNLVDDLDKTLDETREERDRLRAEVERLRPKESGGGWRFFAARDGDFWIMPTPSGKKGWMFGTSGPKEFFRSVCNLADISKEGCYPELTAHDAYARLDGWQEGQRKFRELTGYEPPTCKESLPVQPEERVRCYRSISDPIALWVYSEVCGTFFDDHCDRYYDGCLEEQYVRCQDDIKNIPLSEALGIVRDRPKQLAKLKEMAGIVTPKDSVRCYRSNSGGVWVYGVQHNTYFTSYGDWHPAQSESTTLKNGTRCTISEVRALLTDLPKSLEEFDRITGIETPNDSVRCYRCEDREVVWVYTTSERVCFCTKYDENASVAQDDEHSPSHIPCKIGEARRLLARLPKSLAEFDRITTGRDEDRDHLARLLAIPCKEMRV